MIVSAPTRLNRWRGLRPAKSTHRGPAGPAASQGTIIPFHATQAALAHFVLMVDFTSPGGRTWWAVGVGDTLADALAFAQESCPTDTTWQPIRWNDLYGD
jgi:hypothetical protein